MSTLSPLPLVSIVLATYNGERFLQEQLDSLARRAGLDAAGVIAELLTLELAGLVERLPGGLFQRNHHGDN